MQRQNNIHPIDSSLHSILHYETDEVLEKQHRQEILQFRILLGRMPCYSGRGIHDEPYRWEKIFPELKNSGKGKYYGDILEQAGKQYMEGVKAMEDRINSLNSVYKEQEARMKAVSETLDPGLIAEMRAETVEMTKLLKKLNEKYSQMLEAMTSKQ